MNNRQEELFKNIVQVHVSEASPIGSKFLADKFKMDVSSATIRNDMAELEKEGLVYQPHTSAGRMPTEKGYQYYLDNYLDLKVELADKEKKDIEDTIKSFRSIKGNKIEYNKQLAKVLAGKSNVMVFMAFGKNDLYYTGISNLFSQPEFADIDMVYSISEVVDHCDDIVSNLFDRIKETEIRIGSKNEFSDRCATILSKKNNKLLGLLGPMRMDYEKNLGLVNYMRSLI